ncbi:hypothetical protein ACGFZ3_13460 [Stenotrophomonas sp. NPDC047960]|uniref:hypothetical protein n=1 Tax=Stenotrophomonas sp. NPDC047960 TaxID=3364531 RepID=UPI003720400A
MKDVQGISEMADKLRPHLPEYLKWFDEQNDKFKTLIAADHDPIGRVLKCHLVVEHYLTEWLVNHYGIQDIEKVRLTFAQRANLIPSQGQAVSFMKPGILKLNAIRNDFGHSMEATPSMDDMSALLTVLRVFQPQRRFESPLDIVEAFTTTACTFLLVTPEPLAGIMADVFSKIRME